MKHLVLLFGIVLSFFSSTISAQDKKDVIIMTINGTQIPLSEFEYSYNKNGKGNCSLDDYLDLFINFRLKVAEAKAQSLDTLSSFRKEFSTYRDRQLLPFLVDSLYEDSIVQSVYARMQQQIGDSDLIKVSHIFLSVPPQASQSVIRQKEHLIDSLYTVLQNNGNFSEIAKKYSEDYATARSGGELPWIGPNTAIAEFENVAYSLKVGEISKPFRSSVGFHIILMNGRKKLESYEEKRKELLAMLKAQGLDEQAFKHALELKIAQSGGKLTREDIMLEVLERQISINPSMSSLIKEYYDGLLLFEALKYNVWEPAEKDIVGLQKFFKKNKANYKWSEPHFKGFLFHCKRPEQVKEVLQILKKESSKNWSTTIRQKFNSGKTPNVMISNKIYKKGDNAYVDYLVFHSSKVEPMKHFPYSDVYGKILKSGPESFEDVRGQVVSDYQDQKEKEWVKSLRKKANIEIKQDVVERIKRNSLQ